MTTPMLTRTERTIVSLLRKMPTKGSDATDLRYVLRCVRRDLASRRRLAKWAKDRGYRVGKSHSALNRNLDKERAILEGEEK